MQVWTHAASLSRPVKIVEGSAGRSVSGGVLLASVRLTDSTVCCMNSCGWVVGFSGAAYQSGSDTVVV